MSDSRTSLPAVPTTTLSVTFDAGQLSSDGRLVWRARADDRLGVSAAFAEQIRDWRRGPVRHPLALLLRQRLLLAKIVGTLHGLAGGGAGREERDSVGVASEQAVRPGAAAMVRAYRQVSAQLRAQGLSEVADRFALRAQIVQRRVLRKRGRLLQYLGAWLLALLAGYGYRPARTIYWYLVFVLGFAALYLRVGVVDGHAFNPVEALVFSLTSFHGRGFFPGGLHLDDPVTVLAAGEAVLGLLIEISFIATFTQHFFGTK